MVTNLNSRVLGAKERMELGKSHRAAVSRAAHSDLHPKERTFDPIEVLRSSVEGRIPRLLPLKYSRMAVSPFAFFRGAVSIMAADLARLPHSRLYAQLCGDAHIQNLGSFASPDGKLIFDLNDFDETISGPWEWDLKRMATSILLAGREAQQRQAIRRAAAQALVESYCRSMAEFAHQPILLVARHFIHREGRVRPIHAALRQSQHSNPLGLLKKFTEVDGHGGIRFRDGRPVYWRITGQEAKDVLLSLTKTYRACLSPERQQLFDLFRPLDVGFKVVGTGSVGMRDYIVLFEGNGMEDPLFLQIKQEEKSAYAPYLPSPYRHQGRRVAEGQRAIQPVSDLLLGWTSFGGHEYLVRQLNDHKGSIDLETLKGGGPGEFGGSRR